MTVKTRVPGRLEVPTKLFGQFTIPDLARLGIPLAAAYALNPKPVYLAAAGIASLVWYGWTPYGQHLDKLLYHAARWGLNQGSVEGSKVTSRKEQYFLMEDGTPTAVIEVSPTNLDMKTDSEQQALANIYQDLLDTINYPIQIHSRQRDLNLNNYLREIQPVKPKTGNLYQDYHQYCRNLSNGSHSKTRHYIVVRGDQKSASLLPWRNPSKVSKSELDNRCREIIDTIDTSELQAERLTEGQIMAFEPAVEREDPDIGVNWTVKRDGKFTNHNNKKTLYISEFPSTVELGWPLQILRADGLVDVAQVIEPRDTGKTSKQLQRLSEKLNAEIDSILAQGYRGTNKLETLLEDAEWILDLIADREAKPVDYGVYITPHGTSKKNCRDTLREVKNRLDTLQVEYNHTAFRTDQAFHTEQPLRPDKLNETQLVPTTSAAAGFPFGTQQTNQDHGIIYGVDKTDNTPILADRFSWSSHSMARMGMVGSGKSYAAKVELLRSKLAYENLQIIAVDPKQEYDKVIEYIGGVTQELGETPEFDIQEDDICFQVQNRGQRENVEELVNLVENIYYHASRNQEKTLVLIDEARILMNDEEGRQVLNQFVLEARDTNTAITLISQNASHFTYCREGREILDNMPGKVFMRHDRVPDSVVDYFQLSERERQELYELKTGTDSDYSEAILKITGRLDTRVKIESTQVEESIINQGEEA